jgi:hypothetical protein
VPTISAGVMMAKVIWKQKKSTSGIEPRAVSPSTPMRKAFPRPPTKDERLRTPSSMPVASNARL